MFLPQQSQWSSHFLLWPRSVMGTLVNELVMLGTRWFRQNGLQTKSLRPRPVVHKLEVITPVRVMKHFWG